MRSPWPSMYKNLAGFQIGPSSRPPAGAAAAGCSDPYSLYQSFFGLKVVKSLLRALCRPIARAISLSRSLAYGTPEASQSFGYMLMEVKPGIVLISLKITERGVTRKSTRPIPEQSIALNARTARRRIFRTRPAGSLAGLIARDFPSTYLAS